MAKAITLPTAAASSSTTNTCSTDAASGSPCKRRKSNCLHPPPLLPGLPDHIAELCLSKVDPTFLYSVCRSWRRLLYSPSFPPFLSLYALLIPQLPSPPPPPGTSSPPQIDQLSIPGKIQFSAFDPVASNWRPLPSPISDNPLTLLIRHPSFLSRNFPIQSVSVSGNLVLLAGTAHNLFPAISRPFVFDPIAGRWSAGPALTAPRRWCAAGASAGAVYVASGMGTQFSTDVARSVEKWDLIDCNWKWQKLSGLKDVKFSRDAIDAVAWRGKLCVVNVISRERAVYEIRTDTWHDMAAGMIGGWSGPVAGMDEDVMYVIDVASGALRKYDPERDTWDDVMVSEHLMGAQQIAAAGRRVCAVCNGGASIAVVDVEAAPPRLWLLDTPNGSQAVAIHILPRMSGPDFAEEL